MAVRLVQSDLCAIPDAAPRGGAHPGQTAAHESAKRATPRPLLRRPVRNRDRRDVIDWFSRYLALRRMRSTLRMGRGASPD
jgi:hypothetical protein